MITPGRAMDIGAKIGSTAVPKSPQAAPSTIPN